MQYIANKKHIKIAKISVIALLFSAATYYSYCIQNRFPACSVNDYTQDGRNDAIFYSATDDEIYFFEGKNIKIKRINNKETIEGKLCDAKPIIHIPGYFRSHKDDLKIYPSTSDNRNLIIEKNYGEKTTVDTIINLGAYLRNK